MAADDVTKLQRHLSLLKEEYVKLQNKYIELERRYHNVSAGCQQGVSDENDKTFVNLLLKNVAQLFKQDLYSDITIKLDGQDVKGHRFVLASRSDSWGASLQEMEVLDLSHLKSDIAFEMLKWIYTDQLNETTDINVLVELMKAAYPYLLTSLIERCEIILMPSVNVNNCIKLYTLSEEIKADNLKHYCSDLISCHWNDFKEDDFSHMSAPLLYEMFKSKSNYPLHMAIRMRREDVVFLFLIENNNQLRVKLNEIDDRGDLTLDLSLISRQEGIANTLINHKIDVNTSDRNNFRLLHKSILRGDEFSATFLVNHHADTNEVMPNTMQTPLHMIAAQCWKSSTGPILNVETDCLSNLAELLLTYEADPNLKDIDGNTPMHLAIIGNNSDIFKCLLKCPKIDLESRNINGYSVLWLALEKIQISNESFYAENLISRGCSVNVVESNSGNSLLHCVINSGNEKAALFLISNGAHVNKLNNVDENPLHVACRKGLVETTTALLKNGGSSNQQSMNSSIEDSIKIVGRTPLHYAIFYRHERCVTAILNFKSTYDHSNDIALIAPNFNIQDSSGQSALGLSLVMGLLPVAQRLLAGGASVNIKNNEGLTLLHQSILHHETESALFLIENGADMLIQTKDNKTSLLLAIEQRLPDVVKVLCKYGANVNETTVNGTPLIWLALEHGEEDTASILVQYKCDVDCWGTGPDECLQTLLHRAIDENNENISCFLIRSGCDINTPRKPSLENKGGDEAYDLQTPLHLACAWGLKQVVETLLEHAANLNAKDSEGKSPLHVAIINQHPAIISSLLANHKIDLTASDKKGQTPFTIAMTTRNNKAAQAILHREPRAAELYNQKGLNFLHTAIQKGDVESVLFLLSINVNVNSRVQDHFQLTPLHLAVQAGSEIIVRNLLLAGSLINDRTPQKQTALHIAAAHDQASICICLIENGVDFELLDDNLNNALHVACQKGHLATVKILLTESRINAEAINLRGQNPLHVLAQHGKESSAAIFEFFVECMPEYPINKQDADGNTPLLLAYMNGNGVLCRSIVRAGACLGMVNQNGVSIFNYQVATKQLLFRLLDLLSKEPPWSEGDNCLECNNKFGIATRRHHCRHCGRLLCSKCSEKDMPILKYNLNKPVRVCDTCYDVLTLGS